MPWTSKDAHRHKKNLTPKQARQWAAVANSVLDKCLSEGRARSFCEGRAVQIANGTVGAPAGTAKTHGLVTLRSPLSVAPTRLVLMDPERWQGVWVTVGHPQDPDGMPISARQPQVLSQCAVGHLFNCERSVGRR